MNVGRHMLIYLTSSVVGGVVPLLLIPVLTRELQPEEYGMMVTVMTLVALAIPLLNWGSIPYLGIQYFQTDANKFKKLLSTIWVIPLFSLFVLSTAVAIAHTWISDRFDLPSVWLMVIPLMASAFYFPLVAQTLLRMRRQPYAFAAVELSSAAVNFGLTLTFLLAVGLGWQSRILAAFSATLLISVFALAWLRKQQFLGGPVTPELIRPAVAFGVGVVPHDLANNAMRMLDRLMVALVLGQVAVGSYGVAAQIASVMLFMLGALNKAWTPFVFETLKQDSDAARVALVRRTYQMFAALILFFFAFNLAVPLVYDWMVDARYHASQNAVFWLSLGYLFNGFYLTVVDHIFYLKKTYIVAMITVPSAFVYVGMSYFLLQVVGSVGVAISFAITSFLAMFATFILAQFLSPLPWLKAIRP